MQLGFALGGRTTANCTSRIGSHHPSLGGMALAAASGARHHVSSSGFLTTPLCPTMTATVSAGTSPGQTALGMAGDESDDRVVWLYENRTKRKPLSHFREAEKALDLARRELTRLKLMMAASGRGHQSSHDRI